MKGLGFGILSLLLPLCVAKAQIKWGVQTGFQYSTLYSGFQGNLFEKYGRLNPWKGSILMPGFYIAVPLSARVSVSGTLQYSSKGYLWLGDKYSKSYSYRLPYLAVPILFHYKTQRLSFFAGPEFAYKFISSYTSGSVRLTDETVHIAPFDLGATGGVGFQITSAHSIMLRYTWGLLNVIGKDTEMEGDLGNYGNARDLGFMFNNHALGVVLASEFSYADAAEKKRSISFGLRQGFYSSTLFGEGVDHVTAGNEPIRRRSGYEAGLEIRVGIKKYFFFGTGLSYLQKGGQLREDEPVKVDYLSVPLIVGVSPLVNKHLTFSFYGGVGLHKVVNLENPYRSLFQSDSDIEYEFGSTLFYGLECDVSVSENLSIFLNYKNFWDNSAIFDLENLSFSARGFGLSTGLRLHR
jgi:hypothetical protein